MLYDDLLQLLRATEPTVMAIKSFFDQSTIENDHERLQKQSETEDFWQHPEQNKILQKLQQLSELKKQYQEIVQGFTELTEMTELFKEDESELERIEQEIQALERKATAFKIALLLDDPSDGEPCFLSINAGAGGTESQDWASMLLRMYLRFCEAKKLSAKLIDQQAGEEAGIKSATLYIKGTNAQGLLKSEAGIHRLVRISPFDSSKRRHTSFAAVSVTPEAPDVEITIEPSDLRIDTYRASGAGGQHVNKTESAVRITHMPSGIVVQCQNERSQLQNKETAMKMLRARLAQKIKEEHEAKQKEVQKKRIEWGSQIRSYVLHPYKMVKDHRTNYESPQPDRILDGELDGFIEAFLLWYHAQ